MRYLFILLFSGIIVTSFAQNQGVVITTSGDTLNGKVNFFLSKKFSQMVQVKNQEGKRNFKVYEVLEVKKDDYTYKTISIENVYQFGKLIKNGYLSLYEYVNYEDGSKNFNSMLLVKNSGETLPVPNLMFKKVVSGYLSDCSLVVQKFEDKKYKKTDLHTIVDDYNICISDKTMASVEKTIATKENLEKMKVVDQLIDKIVASDLFDKKDEIIEMLSDLKSKIEKGESLPTYLTKTLRTELKSNNDLLQLFDSIIK